MQIEHIIRDWLVLNPEFIETGLEVIEKEHHLSDDAGTSGFIDILCKDIYSNFVIIEIKRSDTAARETFTEIFKYAELVKQNYKARDSEIRMIILSTHWKEIIRAFSFSVFKSPFAIKGFRITINDQTKIPEFLEEVIPIDATTISRKFMAQQVLCLFLSEEKREAARKVLEQKLNIAQLHDYVIVDLNASKARRPVPYPYAMNIAFQRQTKDKSLLCIYRLNGMDQLGTEESEFDNEEEYQSYLDEAFIAALEMYRYCDSTEIEDGGQFERAVGGEIWEIAGVRRYGIFKTDPRYSDELLLKELKGHDGNSGNKFVGFCESGQKARFNEIKEECQHSLTHTPYWAEFIDHILSQLQKSREKFRLLVDIYNPDSVVTALYYSLTKETAAYLPLFHVMIYYIDQPRTEVYIGELYSLGIEPRLKLFTPMNSNEIMQEIVSLKIIGDNWLQAFRMGLNYAVLHSENIDVEGGEQFIELDEGKIIPDKTNYHTIQDYIAANKESLQQFILNLNSVFHSVKL